VDECEPLASGAATGATPAPRWGQSDKISHIDMGDDSIRYGHLPYHQPIFHINIQDDHIDMVDQHIDLPYPISITHIPYRCSYRSPIDVRSPISVFHIDLPYRSPASILDHILSLCRPCGTGHPHNINLVCGEDQIITDIIKVGLCTRGLHSSTFRLNLSAFCGIGVHLEVI